MKWIKVNEQLPKSSTLDHIFYVVKMEDGRYEKAIQYRNGELEISGRVTGDKSKIEYWLDESNANIAAKIEQFLTSQCHVSHSHFNNELMYGYCSNGCYELNSVDIEELAKYINDEL